MKLKLLLALLALTPGAMAQTVTRLSASKANDYGLVYSLPETVIDIVLTAQCEVKTPGEFYNYAERYFGAVEAAKAVKEPSTQWTLTDVSMSTHGEIPQGAEQWLMTFKSGSPVYVELNEAGVPLAISTDAPEAKPEAAKPESTPLTKTALDTEAARHAVTEDMIASSSLAKRAELAFAKILELRETRQDYLTGEAETMPDGEALKLILSNIDAQEAALTAMFLGTVQTRTDVTTTVYTPGSESDDSTVIARLSPTKGFVAADDLSGAPVYMIYEVLERGKMPKNEKGEDKVFPKGGVAYCIPGNATFAVEYNDKAFPASTFNLAQLGIVFGIDPSFFSDKKNPGFAIFDPVTGGIVTLGSLGNKD